MPLWQIYHPTGTFEDNATKHAFAQDITKMYTDIGLPSFYVVTHFYKMDDENVFVGGKTNESGETPFIRIVITHIALRIPDVDAMYLRTTSRIDKIIKPYVADKGYDFEYHVDETERRLWKINSLIPPPHKSEAEQLWFKENRAVPYEGAYPAVLSQASI
ncbi:uncharacterized protein N7483_006641 [Penicillium malachiteum]|uniref:uncharacterized protein n=1 Tax=Penicillium malachiteum TaxID=1324776 RepID=UPI002546FC4C|nr:uncharacterized protein N7483_006641 [Penicillium malachiteum]KAJ5725284.1 hypothetical protein N7483_006641 [Penicillium malachiteum]